MFKKKSKYYSLDEILKKDCTYNLIIGERSNGKTYATLLHCIKQYFDNGSQFAVVRRWKEDITGRRASELFTAHNANGEITKLSNGKYDGICYYAGKFYLCTYDADTGKPIYNMEDIIAYAFSLTESEHNKSVSYPFINNIVFDEFLTNKLYLPDEFITFMNTVSTIVRQRTDVKIFMLGNTVNKFSPYFEEMGLKNIIKQQQGTIDIYSYGNSVLKVAVEYCKSTAKSKENNFYFAFDNPRLNMITSGAWELDIYPHLPIKYKPKDIIFTYFIEFQEQLFQCEIVNINDNFFTYIHLKTTPLKNNNDDIIYSLNHSYLMNYSRNIYKPTNRIQERILYFFKTDRVFYQNNDVGDTVNNYLKICKKGLF